MNESTSEYKIEKVRRRVLIVITGGARMHGDLFLQPTARYRAGPQDPADLLNDAEPFLPVALDGHVMTFIAKDQIIRVQYEESPADTSPKGAAPASVEIHCTDGTAMTGTLRLEMPADRPRLLDYLNGESAAFLRLVMPTAVCLVNRRQITQVRHRE